MNIYVTAFQRSGSTHVVRSLSRLLGWRVASPQVGFAGQAGTDAHVLNFSVAVTQWHMMNLVLHHHAPSTGNNQRILSVFGARPVVVIRNVYDCLVSFHEQMDISKEMTACGQQRPEWDNMSVNEQWLWMCYNAIPWYLSFYASWCYTTLPILWVHYDDYYADQTAGIRKILEHVEYNDKEFTDYQIEKATSLKNGRFNFGVSGRGETGVPDWVKASAERQCQGWGPLGKKMWEELLCRR